MIARKDKVNDHSYVGPILLVKHREKGKYCYLMEKIILLEQNNHQDLILKTWIVKKIQKCLRFVFT